MRNPKNQDILTLHGERIGHVEKSLKYSFKEKNLILSAITHSTYSYENKNISTENNERLEFLGDSVLDLVIGEILFNDQNVYDEGTMTKIRALVVCENTLCEVAKELHLGEKLLLGKGEETTGGRSKNSNLSDAVEAVVAAVYLDGGIGEAGRVVEMLFSKYIKEAKKGRIVYDYKSRFWEFVQSIREQESIKFNIVKEEGPVHKRKFYSQVVRKGEIIGSGNGSTKKEAEQNAAKEALCKMTEEHYPEQSDISR